MRSVALDVHRDFCEVAVKDESGLRLAGRHRYTAGDGTRRTSYMPPNAVVEVRR
jgi:hypothetical protein